MANGSDIFQMLLVENLIARLYDERVSACDTPACIRAGGHGEKTRAGSTEGEEGDGADECPARVQ